MLLSAPFLILNFLRGEYRKPRKYRQIPHYQIDCLNRLVDNMEYFLMPKQYQAPSNGRNLPEYKFASIRLTDDQKAHFTGWLADNQQGFEEVVASFTLSGHKVSFSFDGEHDCYIASLTCNDKKSDNYAKVLTSRAEDWFTAMMMNCYKAIVLCDGGTWPTESNRNNWG